MFLGAPATLCMSPTQIFHAPEPPNSLTSGSSNNHHPRRGDGTTAEEQEQQLDDDIFSRRFDDGYDAQGRQGAVRKFVNSVKKRYTSDASVFLTRPTVASRRKTQCRTVVPLEEARRLHDKDSKGAVLQLGPKQCRIENGVSWLAKLKGDPLEEKRREHRRAAELASAQTQRAELSEREGEVRLRTLSAGLKAEMETFLAFLLDWASSAAVMSGRSNEMAVLEQQEETKALNRYNRLSALVGEHRLHLLGGGFDHNKFNTGRAQDDPKQKQQQQQQQQRENDHDGEEDQDDGGKPVDKRATSVYSFLRDAARQAGSAELTVDAYAQLASYFSVLDIDGGGALSLDEVVSAAEIIGRRDTEQITRAMKMCDADGSGAVSLNEVIAGVFFPHLGGLAPIVKFQRQNRAAIERRLDPKHRMHPDDLRDISMIYRIFDRMQGGCTAENMLSRMSSYARYEHPEMVTDAVKLFSKSGTGRLTDDEFFEFLKFSYAPYTRQRTDTEAENERLKERSAADILLLQSQHAASRPLSSSASSFNAMSQSGGDNSDNGNNLATARTNGATAAAAAAAASHGAAAGSSPSVMIPRPPITSPAAGAGGGGPMAALSQTARLRQIDRGRVSRNILDQEKALEAERKKKQAEAEQQAAAAAALAASGGGGVDAKKDEDSLNSSSGTPSNRFSIEKLADARWAVIQSAVRNKVSGHSLMLRGMRDLPAGVGTVKERFLQDEQRRGQLHRLKRTIGSGGGTTTPQLPNITSQMSNSNNMNSNAAAANTSRVIRSMSPRVTVETRLQSLLGIECFDARGNFSPDRKMKSHESHMSLERVRSKLVASATSARSPRS